MYINVEALPSPRLARVTFTCVCVCVCVIRMCVCVYMCAERERSLFFFDERIELNSHENSSPIRRAQIFARARRTTSACHISNVNYY